MDAEYFEHCKDIINRLQASKYAWFIEARPVVIFDGKDCNSYNTEQKKYMMTPLKRLPDANFLLKNINLFNPYESIAVYDDDSALGKTSSDYINNKENFFKDWICKVGDESIILQPNGNIVGSCGASIFNRDVNIFDDLFDNFVMSNNIQCPFNSCNCQPENHLSKWKF